VGARSAIFKKLPGARSAIFKKLLGAKCFRSVFYIIHILISFDAYILKNHAKC
jgi:hypothetical protein